jgi:hypothetical protein
MRDAARAVQVLLSGVLAMPAFAIFLALIVSVTAVLGAVSVGSARTATPPHSTLPESAKASPAKTPKADSTQAAARTSEVVREKAAKDRGPVLDFLMLLLGSSKKR